MRNLGSANCNLSGRYRLPVGAAISRPRRTIPENGTSSGKFVSFPIHRNTQNTLLGGRQVASPTG